MPRRSSRSRPASFTSWSEPTGSASRTAMHLLTVMGSLRCNGCTRLPKHAVDRTSSRWVAPWRTPDRPTYRAAVKVVRFLTRAFAVATWRELGYLLAGGVTAAIAFGVVVAGTIVGTLCAILIIGLPVLI